MTKIVFNIVFFILTNTFLFSQNDPVLFSVNGKDVGLSEFQYIYSKNNGNNADYSKASLEEYLDLYVNFKLKVEEARSKKIDTLKSYIDELAGYRRQLADSYIMEKELSSKIARKAYDRMQKDVEFSHILISAPTKSSPSKNRDAFNKIKEAQKELKVGKRFEDVVEKYSDDKKSKERKGSIGYMTAPLPDGFYDMEEAIYTTPKGSYSDIIKTKLGYHILKVTNSRPARGKIKVAHILIRSKYKGIDNPDAAAQAENIYKELKEGIAFDIMVRQSQDNNTKDIGGILPEFGIGKYATAFEDAAFGLKKIGDYSKPVQTNIGFHIIQLVGKPILAEFEVIKNQLIKQTNKGERQEAGKLELYEEIKREANFKSYTKVMQSFVDGLDKTFYQYNWKPVDASSATLCQFGEETYSIQDYADFCRRNGRVRMQHSGDDNFNPITQKLFNKFIAEKAIDYQQERLEEKYADFRNLMREYEEGILLFEVTKEEVWDKASNDEAGIKAHYEKNKSKYTWPERANVVNYSIRSTDPDVINKILKKSGKQKPSKIAETFNDKNAKTELVMYTEEMYQKDQKGAESLEWRAGATTAPKINNALKMTTFSKVLDIMPTSQKTLDEAKGFVISDHQAEVEKTWIKLLKAKYPLKIKSKTLNKLVK